MDINKIPQHQIDAAFECFDWLAKMRPIIDQRKRECGVENSCGNSRAGRRWSTPSAAADR